MKFKTLLLSLFTSILLTFIVLFYLKIAFPQGFSLSEKISYYIDIYPNLLYSFIYIGLFVLLTMILYFYLYKWRAIQISFRSFAMFFINIISFMLFIFGCFNLLNVLETPIRVSDLSIFSHWKYFTFFVIALVIVIFYYLLYFFSPLLITKYREKLPGFTDTFILLETWNDSFFGPICHTVINWVSKSKKHLFLYFFVHFCVFYIIKIIHIAFFISFCFFYGDLRYNLILLPISFIIWILRFLDRYGQMYYKNHLEYFQSIFSVNFCDTKISIDDDSTFVYASNKDLIFSLKSKAFSENLAESDLEWLIPLWKRDMNNYYYYYYYKKYTNIFQTFLFILKILCWSSFAYNVITSGFPNSFFNAITRIIPKISSNPNNFRDYATAAHEVIKNKQKFLEKHSGGAYKAGHKVTTDTDKVNSNGEVEFIHQPTHGKGTSEHPSLPLHPVEDLVGNAKPQRATYAKDGTWFPKEWLGPEVPGSKKFYEKEEVKENMKKNTDSEN